MFKKTAVILTILLIDLILYIVIGLILLDYEDFYDESKGPYWGLGSMTVIQKIAFISYYLLIAVNILAVAYIGYKIYKKVFLEYNR